MRTIQIALFLFMFNSMLAFVNLIGLFQNTTVLSDPSQNIDSTMIFMQNIINNILKDITTSVATTLIFGFLLYVFKPMNIILSIAVLLSNFIMYSIMSSYIPNVISAILVTMVMIFYVIDYMTYVSKGATETGG